MAKIVISVTAKKNLIDDLCILCFTKGKKYNVLNNTTNKEMMLVLDNQTEKHTLGNWYKHFIYNYE